MHTIPFSISLHCFFFENENHYIAVSQVSVFIWGGEGLEENIRLRVDTKGISISKAQFVSPLTTIFHKIYFLWALLIFILESSSIGQGKVCMQALVILVHIQEAVRGRHFQNIQGEKPKMDLLKFLDQSQGQPHVEGIAVVYFEPAKAWTSVMRDLLAR